MDGLIGGSQNMAMSPARPTEVGLHSDRLNETISRLESSLSQLTERLASVIRNTPETEAANMQEKEPTPSTVLAKELMDKRMRIEKSIQVVRFLTSHLEI